VLYDGSVLAPWIAAASAEPAKQELVAGKMASRDRARMRGEKWPGGKGAAAIALPSAGQGGEVRRRRHTTSWVMKKQTAGPNDGG